MLPPANADAPTSLSSLLLLGPHGIGGSTDEVELPRGDGLPRRVERGARPRRTPARIMTRETRMEKGLAAHSFKMACRGNDLEEAGGRERQTGHVLGSQPACYEPPVSQRTPRG